jgi:hypothetical protein
MNLDPPQTLLRQRLTVFPYGITFARPYSALCLFSDKARAHIGTNSTGRAHSEDD